MAYVKKRQKKTEVYTDELAKCILKSYILASGVVDHQISSMNWFYKDILPFIVTDENKEIHMRDRHTNTSHTILFENLSMTKPTIKENDGMIHQISNYECRVRGLTYASCCFVDITHTIFNVDGDVQSSNGYKNIMLFKIPCMLGSVLCHTSDMSYTANSTDCVKDCNGYFIINGIEKVILSQEKLRTNHPYFFKDKKLSKYTYVCEIRSCHESKKRSTSTLYTKIRLVRGQIVKDSIVVQVPFIDKPIELSKILKIIGLDHEWQIQRIISPNIESIKDTDTELYTMLKDIIRIGVCDKSRDEIFEEMADYDDNTSNEKSHKYYVHIFKNEFLPHISVGDNEESWMLKSIFFGKIVFGLVQMLVGSRISDDRDHYSNKRIDTAGMLMSLLFRQIFRNFLKTITMTIHRTFETKKVLNIMDIFNSKRITARLKYAMSTGNWQAYKGMVSSQVGVVQMLNRMTVMACISNLRRIGTPINKESKSITPRQLHTSSWGVVCPTETPEGASCGLIKNLAMGAHIRISVKNDVVASMVMESKFLIKVVDTYIEGVIPPPSCVFLDGNLVGYTENKELFVDELRYYRRKGMLPMFLSISVAGCDIQICNDHGCLLRPVIRGCKIDEIRGVCIGKYNLWKRLLHLEIIEYIDKDEEMNLRIAVSHDEFLSGGFTHMEIHPSLILGLCASLIPFSNFNQAPRNTYQSAMGKQSMGLCTSNMQYRMDTVSYALNAPEKPLVSTWMEDILRTDYVAAGCNPIVAIACYLGYNQEDSIILNQASVDRGLFRCVVYHSYKDEVKCSGTDKQKFCRPVDPSITNATKIANYDKIGDDGMPRVGEDIQNNDVIIGKAVTTRDVYVDGANKQNIDYCQSTVVRHIEKSSVDMVCKSINKSGNGYVKVRTISNRTPEIGDKFTSRHGQKGVCGILLPHEDMPYSADGIVPDIIINPHCIPSRMTIAHMIESLLGKLCCLKGETGDGTPFRDTSIDSISKELHVRGYERHGNETMFNGMTGEVMDGSIFLCPVHYQKLRHMVLDKRHARSRGPKTLLTRQPVEGRSREGGLRFGEMERDCVISHGVSSFLRERLFEVSDPFDVAICSKCGNFAEPSCADNRGENFKYRTKTEFCRNCFSKDDIHMVKIPYAFKLLIQEINAMGIKTKLNLSC